LVLVESTVMGVIGAALGIALGTGLATLALSLIGGDLGGEYFATGTQPPLQWSWPAALLYGGLGVLAAIWGGVLPARLVQRLAPARALKGATTPERSGIANWVGPVLIVVGTGLAFLPPVNGLPVWAYVATLLLMTGGIECVPGAVNILLTLVMRLWPRASLQRNAPAFLALERVRHMRQSATVAIAGIVVSLGLSIALTVMVHSFRSSITQWLDTLLPADLYVRTGLANGGSDALHIDQAMLKAVRQQPGVRQAMGVRVVKVNLRQGLAPVVLIARPMAPEPGETTSPNDAAYQLPLIGAALPPKPGVMGIYVSEIMSDLYAAKPGGTLQLPLRAGQPPVEAYVRGIWRDYAHQQGALIVDQADYQRHSGDHEINDIALWANKDTDVGALEQQVRQAAIDQKLEASQLIFNEPGDIRQSTLKVFDRSFAVTYWLQAVAIGIGLFGISASFSGQILARRKEFGLLSHLGFTREQTIKVLAGEGAALTAVGALMGLALGLGVSAILIHVVNPQSFHWTMEMQLPWQRLALLCGGMVAAGTLTAYVTGNKAVSSDVVKAVKEDW
jgi:putative ABC transport system permease protein